MGSRAVVVKQNIQVVLFRCLLFLINRIHINHVGISRHDLQKYTNGLSLLNQSVNVNSHHRL